MKKKIVVAVLTVVLACAFALVGCGANKNNVKIVEVKLTDEEYAFGVDKAQTDLKNRINAVLEEIMADGNLGAIAEKYFDDSEESERLKIDGGSVGGSKAAKQLVVATNSDFEPFEYKAGNQFTGIDMEVVKLIADRLEMELVIVDMDFDSVVTSVGSNNIDLAVAGLTVSDDRKLSVDFTTSYYKASQMIIVKEDNNDFDGCTTVEAVENVLKGLAGKKAGYQNGTTGGEYIKGSEDFGFAGFSNITAQGYDSGALAVQDLKNGNIDLVVIDEMPARSIVKKTNK